MMTKDKKKKNTVKRDKVIQIWCTQEEKEHIQKIANKLSISMSTYGRLAMMGRNPKSH